MIAKTCRGRPIEVNEDRMLDVAADLFANRGFDGTTTREISKKARCNLALISYHFGGKLGLYRAVIKRHLNRVAHHLDQSIASYENGKSLPQAAQDLFATPGERLLYISLYALADMIIGNEQMQKVICREMMSNGNLLAKAFMKSENTAYQLLRKTITELMRRDFIKRKIDIQIAVVGLLGPIVYSCIAAPLIKDVYGIEKIDDEYKHRLCTHLTQGFFAQYV